MRLLLQNWWLILSSLLLGTAMWAADRAIAIEGQCNQMIAEAQEKCSSLDQQRADLAAKMDQSKDILEIIKVATDILKLQKQQNQILQEALRKRQELDDDRSLHECYFMFAMIALMAWVLVVAWVRQLSARRRKRRPRFFFRERPDIVSDGEERAEL